MRKKIIPGEELQEVQHKKKKKPEVFNFSAIHLIHDPQGTIIMTSQVPCWLYLPI